MKAVILAAGMGKRLAPTGWNKPKCLIEFGGRGLLDHLLDSLAQVDVRHVVAVVGYQEQLVRQTLAEHDVRVEYVVNGDYAETNTIHSLYLAREHLGEDFLYFNADVLFDWRILPMLLGGEASTMAIQVGRCAREEVKVVVNGRGRIVRIGKKLPADECLGEFVGLAKFAQAACADFVASLVRYNEDLGERDLFFESAVDPILSSHEHLAVTIDPLRAVEIDDADDLEQARELFDRGVIQTPPT